MTPEEVRAALKSRHACCSPREVSAVLDLLKQEREACAEIVDRASTLDEGDNPIYRELARVVKGSTAIIAKAIRARE